MENNNEFLKRIGNKIRIERLTIRMSIAKLSELSGVNKAVISYVESGRNNFHILTLKAIADVLSIDIKEFL